MCLNSVSTLKFTLAFVSFDLHEGTTETALEMEEQLHLNDSYATRLHSYTCE